MASLCVHNGRQEVGAKDRSCKDALEGCSSRACNASSIARACKDAEDKVDFFDFHEKGNTDCEACVIPPVVCELCGVGLVHTQFDETLEATEGECDMCLPEVHHG